VILGKLLSVEAKMSALEKKVDAMSKAFYLILFEKAEAFPKEEVEELKKRLNAYLQHARAHNTERCFRESCAC